MVHLKMATIQFELERLYDLVAETQTQKDKIAAELDTVHTTLDETCGKLDETRGLLEEKRDEIDELRVQNARLREFVKKAEHENYALNHRLDCLKDTYHITYEYLNQVRRQNRLLEKQIDDLTNGRIKYKKAVDPDDLEEYTVGHRIYLRDVLTDAIYTRHGKLFGYLEEDTGKLVKVRET